MASSFLLKRSSSALTKFFQPLRSVSATPSISRSFNAKAKALREAAERDLDRRRSESRAALAKIFGELSDTERDNDKRRSESESESALAKATPSVSATPSSDDERDIDQRRSESEAKMNAKLFREAERDNDKPRSEDLDKILGKLQRLAKATPSVSATPSSDDERDIDQRRSESGLRRRDLPFTVFDPITGSSIQVLHTVDQRMNRPLSDGLRRNMNAKEDNDALHLRAEMPGLGKEDVKVSVEENILTIKGEGEESTSRYSSRIYIPPKLYKLDGMKAEMKNGVLKVVVPKVKEDEGKYAHQVQVE